MKQLPLHVAVVGYVVGGALVVVGGACASVSASADTLVDNGRPGMLSLVTGELPEWSHRMEPGDAVSLPITVVLEDADHGELSMVVALGGLLAEHPDGLQVLLERCATPWVGGTCSTGALAVVSGSASSLGDGSPIDLGTIGRGSGPYVLATLWLPDVMPSDLQGSAATFALGFTAFDDTATVTLPGPLPNALPNTGSGPLGGLLLASGLVVCGLVFTRYWSTRNSRARPSRSQGSVPQAEPA